MIFRTPYVVSDNADRFEYPTGVSLTVPDQSYTIRELLERFTSGTMPPVYQDGSYDDNPDFDYPDPTADPAFDLADYTERSEAAKRRASVKKADEEAASLEKAAAATAPPPASSSE